MKEENSVAKTNINWYPGHMAKTKRLIKENINLIDIVYEIIDARIPFSSKITDIDDLIKNKKRILIFNKADLCDIKVTKKWVEYYNNLGYTCLLMNAKDSQDYKKLISITNNITNDIINLRIKKGISNKDIRALVIGIPNVGKSTIINKLVGKKVAQVGNKPGITKSLSWIKTKSNIILLDTPGVLWPKIENNTKALNLAVISAIKIEILPVIDIANYLFNFYQKNYPSILENYYKVSYTSSIDEIYLSIAKKIGACKEDEIDYEKVAFKVYNDIVSERVHGITFDIWEDTK